MVPRCHDLLLPRDGGQKVDGVDSEGISRRSRVLSRVRKPDAVPASREGVGPRLQGPRRRVAPVGAAGSLIDTPSVCTISSCQAHCSREASGYSPGRSSRNLSHEENRRDPSQGSPGHSGAGGEVERACRTAGNDRAQAALEGGTRSPGGTSRDPFRDCLDRGLRCRQGDTLRGPVPAERREEHARHAAAGRGAWRRPGHRALLPPGMEDAVFRLRRARDDPPPDGQGEVDRLHVQFSHRPAGRRRPAAAPELRRGSPADAQLEMRAGRRDGRPAAGRRSATTIRSSTSSMSASSATWDSTATSFSG